MKRTIKSYLAFTTAGYRVICLLVCPLVLLAFSGFILATIGEVNGGFPEYTLYMYVVVYGLLSDYWMFGGMCSRENNGMEYVKTSGAGIAVLRKGIIGDLLRHFVYIMGYGVFCSVFSGYRQDIVTAMLAYIAVAAFLNVTRYMIAWQFQLFASFGAAVIFGIFTIVCWLLAASEGAAAVFWTELAISSVLALAVSIITVWHMTYCVKGSYYEK